MVHKNNKWNISKERGEEIAHKYIIEILSDAKKNMMPLSELVIYLNQRTKHIKIINHQKKKPLSVYLKCVYGSIINFMDNFTFYGVIQNGADIKIKLLEEELAYQPLNKKILNEHKEWILVDTEEFIFV